MASFKDFIAKLPSTSFAHCKRNAKGEASTSLAIPNVVLAALADLPQGITGGNGVSAKQAFEAFVATTVGWKIPKDPKELTSQVSSVLDFWFVKDDNEWSKSPIQRETEGRKPIRYFYREVEDVATGVRCAPRPVGRGESSKEIKDLTSKIEFLTSLDIPEDIKKSQLAPLQEQLEAAKSKGQTGVSALRQEIESLKASQASQIREAVAAALLAAGVTVKPV